MEKEEFKKEVQDQLGLSPGQECDKICGAMSEEEFREFVEYVKEALQRKKRRLMKEMVPAVYA
jgi:predicted transcriptional regulator